MITDSETSTLHNKQNRPDLELIFFQLFSVVIPCHRNSHLGSRTKNRIWGEGVLPLRQISENSFFTHSPAIKLPPSAGMAYEKLNNNSKYSPAIKLPPRAGMAYGKLNNNSKSKFREIFYKSNYHDFPEVTLESMICSAI